MQSYQEEKIGPQGELLKKQGREYKRQRIKNKKIDRDLGK